ncbi:MAG: peptide chain release factor N(5)-glutamine methyltransferase [Geminicoccaceae bacterium]
MTIRDSLAKAAGRLEEAGVEPASREAALLLSHAMNWDRATLLAHAGDELSDADHQTFFDLVERRAEREPAAQIFGCREFWSLPFVISKEVLCPRPDSETLVEIVLTLSKERFEARNKPIRLLDLGTGSGCLVLSLLHEIPDASAVGVDQSLNALAIARTNGERLELSSRASWLCADWGTALDGVFDIIVSNPPYVRTDEWRTLEPEVRLFEPETALLAGDDGLDAYRLLAPEVKRLLAPEGIACFEHGQGQGDAIVKLMATAGLTCIARKADLAGIGRCLAFERACSPSTTP